MASSVYSLIAWFDVFTVLLCLSVFVLVAWFAQSYLHANYKNLPPGPTHWPIVGCIPELLLKRKSFKELLESLSQKYGPVCMLSGFGQRALVVSGYEAVHEAMNKVEFDSRPKEHSSLEAEFGELVKGEGVIMSSGEHWKEHRRFALTVLRGFGVGKRSFESQIDTESDSLLNEIQSLQGSPFDPTHLFCNAVSNVICLVVMGKRFEYDDPEFKRLLHFLEDSEAHAGAALLYFAVPFLRKIPFLPTDGMSSVVSLRQKLKDIVDQHRDTLDKDNMRDFIDAYIHHMQMKKDEGVDTSMSDIELLSVVHDFFLAGTETTSTTLRWALLYMMKYPDIQQRVHDEIDAVVGRDRLPKLSDKTDLPYTEAVIHEVQRCGAIVLIAALRTTVEDTVFRGYTIPKGTHIVSHLRSATRDPSVWQDPDTFRPERFLDGEGCVKKIKEGLVFGSGPRVCLGEQLARMELFIFFTHLMHRFSFKKSSETIHVNINPQSGGILTPVPYQICAIQRN